MKVKNQKYVIATIAVSLLICLVIGAAILFPVPDQLTHLQNMINKKGKCSLSAGDKKFDIQADIATIDNDAIIFKRTAKTGDDSYVIISFGSNSTKGSFQAKNVSIRFITTPKKCWSLVLLM